jgi:winged helix DNA-binding protein
VNFRQRAGLRVRSARQALEFVESVGLCSTFYVFPEAVPSLWEAVVGRPRPRWPRRSHHDAGIGLTWNLKDTLPSQRQVYYGKLVKGRPVLVALDLFPAFYALVRGSQRARDYGREYQAGRMSQSAKRIVDSLMRESPQYTRSLRAECFMLEPSRTREFERAMAELQQGLWIVKTEERYEPSFSYRWDLLERWLPEPTAAGRRLGRPAAVDQLLTRYLRAAVYSTPARVARLFSVPRNEVEAALARLDRAGVVQSGVEIAGEPGRWVVSV